MILKEHIKNLSNWKEYKSFLETKTKQEKGKSFEELTKYYLQYNPVYKSKLKQVWLFKEIPQLVLKKLALPSNDQGIDLIAETVDGSYWAIQCKYLQDEDNRLSHRSISTFISLSKGLAKNISYCLVCTTLDDYAKIYQGNENIGFCTSDEWRKLDKDFFDWLRTAIAGKNKKRVAYQPKPHQAKALKDAKDYFINQKNKRGKLIFPCGAGKSLTGYWITRELNAKQIIVAVPSLSLVKQTLEVYLRETLANNDEVSWLCVCSDEGIGKNDDITVHTNEIGVPCVTDKHKIAEWLKKNKKHKTIIFSTYQSGKTIAEACKMAKHRFDLGIMDEAHKTVGDKDKLFSHLLFDNNMPIDKRIFMTATERRYAGASDTVLSMDDVEVYGDTFTQLSFKEAIEISILSDYKIVTLFISNEEVKKLINENAFVKPTGKDWDKETEARTLAALIALRKAMAEYPIHHAVTFHSSIKKAEAFEQSQALFSKAFPGLGNVQSFHVSGAMPTSVRGKVVDEFAASKKAIITNAKCLTEGVDVPNIDCVLFADPRKSTVDIVQAVGRALRKKEGKEYGYVILPVFTNSKTSEEIIESDEFKEILSTLRALAANDERIIEYFKDISKGKERNKRDTIITFEIDEKIAAHLNEKELISSIELRAWNKLAKLSWMPFEEAREFVRGLNLKNNIQWYEFAHSNERPLDLPIRPDSMYSKNGWISWADFLNTKNYKYGYLNYEVCRTIILNKKISSIKEYKHFVKSSESVSEIPIAPDVTYKNKGWKSWGEFLGTGKVASQNIKYRPFEDVKKYINALGIKTSEEWFKYYETHNVPMDIPKILNQTYKDKGWTTWKDFLNSKKNYKSFEDAKKFVRALGIKNSKEWRTFCKSGKKPIDLPSDLENAYLNQGWSGMQNFLGTDEKYISYFEAKKIIAKLNLKSRSEWFYYCDNNKGLYNIPKTADKAYKGKGWKGWADFLGKEK